MKDIEKMIDDISWRIDHEYKRAIAYKESIRRKEKEAEVLRNKFERQKRNNDARRNRERKQRLQSIVDKNNDTKETRSVQEKARSGNTDPIAD